MGGFKDKNLNNFAKQRIFDDMIKFIFVSLENMKNTYILQSKKIQNDEEKIRTHLVQNYLNNDIFRNRIGYGTLGLRFETEVPENYDKNEEEYIGRIDIRVISYNYFLNTQDYYSIECKRIDGTTRLNKLFIAEGVCRFVLENPKYSSFHNKNVMLGFVVKNIDIEKNARIIDEIQSENANIHMLGKMCKCNMEKQEYYLYRNKYECGDKQIELSHMFYNLAEIIK